jgi:hypothetical protein
MMVWSLVATHSISQAQAELAEMATKHGQAENVAAELAGLENGLRELRTRVQSMREIDSRIDVASILAELSFLMDEGVVLSRVELIAEKFVRKQQAEPSQSAGTVVRAVQAKPGDKKEMLAGNVRFKVVIAGVAADASDVGVLMCKLEDSPYFCQVILAFSRDIEITNRTTPSPSAAANASEAPAETKTGAPEGGPSIQASEFEINCYLANYREQ